MTGAAGQAGSNTSFIGNFRKILPRKRRTWPKPPAGNSSSPGTSSSLTSEVANVNTIATRDKTQPPVTLVTPTTAAHGKGQPPPSAIPQLDTEPIPEPPRITSSAACVGPHAQMPMTETTVNPPSIGTFAEMKNAIAAKSEEPYAKSVLSPPLAMDIPPQIQSLPPEPNHAKLWDTAYNKVRDENPALLLRYERLLSSYREEEGSSVGEDDLGRQSKMLASIRGWLDAVSKRELAMAGDDRTEVSPSFALNELVLGAFESAPDTAVIWAATCMAAETLFQLPRDAEETHSDISYVISRTGWYIALSLLPSALETQDAWLGLEMPELESIIADLYYSVLSFEITAACSYSKSENDIGHRHYITRILDLENTLATSFIGKQIVSCMRQLTEPPKKDGVADEEGKTDAQEDKKTQGDDDEEGQDSYTREEAKRREREVQAIIADLGAIDPLTTIPIPTEAEAEIVKPLYSGVIAPNQSCREFFNTVGKGGSDQDQVLWISGPAGPGKTALMQAFLRELSPALDLHLPPNAAIATCARPERLAYFFCGSSRRGPENAVSVLRSLVKQILDDQPFSREHLLEKERVARNCLSRSNDFYALSELFSNIVRDTKFGTTFIAVDAVDDVVDDASGISDLIMLIAASAKMAPKKVKWLVSTTSRTRGHDLLSRCLAGSGAPRHIHLDLHNQGNRLDSAFETYISYQIDDFAKIATRGGQFRKDLTHVLLAKSERNFLWVNVACQIIRTAGTPWNALKTLQDSIPAGLEALYRQMRAEIASRPWDAEFCTHVLETAALACRPLKIGELQDLRELPSEVDLNIMVSKICYPFLMIQNNTVYFAHKYAQQALLLCMGPGVAAAHATMAELCLKKACAGRKSAMSVRYAAIYWAKHLAKTRDSGDSPKGDHDGRSIHKAMKSATDFLERHFLRWVETIAISGVLKEALVELEKLVKALGKAPRDEISHQCLKAVKEAVLFLRFYGSSGSSGDKTERFNIRNAVLFCPDGTAEGVKARLVQRDLRWISQAYSSGREWNPLVQTLRDHDDWVRCCVYSAGGSLLASAADDWTVRLWDAETGTLQRRFPVSDDRRPVRRVIFSPPGGPFGASELLAAANSGIICIWELVTGQLKRSLKSRELKPQGSAFITDIGFSPDGKTLVVGIGESVVTIDVESLDSEPKVVDWVRPKDTEADESVSKAEAKEHVQRVVYSSELDSWLLATSQGKEISLWNCETRTVLRTLTGHTAHIRGLAFSPNSRFLASASADATVRIWSVDSGRELRLLRCHTDEVASVSFSLDSARVASGSDDTTVRVWAAPPSGWDSAGPVTCTVLAGSNWAIQWVSFSPTEERIASASNDSTVRIWDSEVGRAEVVREREAAVVTDDDEKRTAPRVSHTGGVSVLAFSPNGKILASGHEHGMVCLWIPETGGNLQPLVASEAGLTTAHERNITSLVFSSSGKLLVSTSSDRHARVWDVVSGKMKFSLAGHDDWVRGAAISPDERLVATACDDGGVRLWDMTVDKAGGSVTTLHAHDDYVYSVAFSPDGRYLASGGDDCKINLWDVAASNISDVNKEPAKSMSGPGIVYLRSLVFTHDGAQILSSSVDQTVAIWDVETGKFVRKIRNLGAILQLQINPQHPDQVMTQVGTWPLAQLERDPQQRPEWSPLSLTNDNCWIKWHNKDVVFIPEQFRYRSGEPSTQFHGFKVAVGSDSGQIVLLEFKEGVEPATGEEDEVDLHSESGMD